MTYDKMTGVTLDMLVARLQTLGLTLPLSDNIKLLAQPLTLGQFRRTFSNRHGHLRRHRRSAATPAQGVEKVIGYITS